MQVRRPGTGRGDTSIYARLFAEAHQRPPRPLMRGNAAARTGSQRILPHVRAANRKYRREFHLTCLRVFGNQYTSVTRPRRTPHIQVEIAGQVTPRKTGAKYISNFSILPLKWPGSQFVCFTLHLFLLFLFQKICIVIYFRWSSFHHE